MNERIRKLANVWANRRAEDEKLGIVYTFSEPALEQFAKLLIKECINIVNEQKECLHEEQQYWHDRDYGYALAVDDASKGIKQFFGVEE